MWCLENKTTALWKEFYKNKEYCNPAHSFHLLTEEGVNAVDEAINYINQNSFWYYTDRNYSKYVPEVDCRFQAARLWTVAPSDFHKNNNILYVYADLCALKGQHQPGPCKI